MSKKLESNNVVILNAIVILVFLTVLVFVNLYYHHRMNITLSNINDTYNRKLDIIAQMSRIVRDRSLSMLNMYLSDNTWEIDKQYMDFHQQAVRFIDLRDRLAKMPLSGDERIALNKARELIRLTQPLQNDIVERLHSGEVSGVREDITDRDMPLENTLWESFNYLAQIVRDNAANARLEAKDSYQQSIYIVIAVALVLAGLIILLMMNSLRKIQRIETRLIDKAENLSWQATHDSLTSIWNRRFLEHKVNQLIDTESVTNAHHHVLIYIDLDNFKPINDNYGHPVGDTFLKAISQSLEPCIRKNDTLARVGGDEFAVLLENCSIENARHIAECIQNKVAQCSITLDTKKTISIDGCSIGIAAFGNELEDFDQLIKKADAACYSAKRGGKNRIMPALD
jgi:diguanylate cyclase (GGDEF)-like protein